MTREDMDAAAGEVQRALGHYLNDGEIIVNWVVTFEVAGQAQYLAHRMGGGVDGADRPATWSAIGMTRSAMLAFEQDLAAEYEPAVDEDDEEGED